MKTLKLLGVAVAALSFLVGWAMLLPQYFPYDSLTKIYFSLS